MAYPTIADLPPLDAMLFSGAQPLVLVKSTLIHPDSNWDLRGIVSIAYADENEDELFSLSVIENATYDIFSHSFRDPYWITLYDRTGKAIAVDNESDYDEGNDFLSNFVAPYTGTVYVDAGWRTPLAGTDLSVSLKVYADLDTIPKPTGTINGSSGDDRFLDTSNADLVNGGGGVDTMQYSGKRSDYDLVKNGAEMMVYSLVNNDGLDSLRSVERLSFADSVTDTRHSDLAQALYVSYFGRAADTGGLKNFQARLSELNAPSSAAELSARYDTDAGVKSLIDSFGSSAESTALHSGDNKAFVRAIYKNLLGREPDQGGLDFWTGAINAGTLTRANASLSIMAGAQDNSSEQGKMDAMRINNKISVASNFTYGLETEGKQGAYNGQGAAAVARELLKEISSITDVFAYQVKVMKAVASLPTFAAGLAPLDNAPPPAHAEAPAILLSGVDSQLASFLYA